MKNAIPDVLLGFNETSPLAIKTGTKSIPFFKNKMSTSGDSTVSCSDSDSSPQLDVALWKLRRKNGAKVLDLRMENARVRAQLVNQQIEMSKLQTQYLELARKLESANLKLRRMDKVGKTLRSGWSRPDKKY